MSKNIAMTLAMAGLIAAVTMGHATLAAEAKQSGYVQQIKLPKMKVADLRQPKMPRQTGMKIPGTSFELPNEIGGCKLSMKSWQSTINKLLKEEC